MEEFADTIRRARLARGWSQRDLGQRVGMSQRAVSTWERGTAEPDDAIKERLRDVLGLRDPAAPPAPAVDRDYLGRTGLGDLDFSHLEPGEFEDFTTDVLQALHPHAHAHRVGTSGDTQDGYDVLVEQGGRLTVGAQCKRVKSFGPEKVHEAVNDAKTVVASSVLVLSRIASPGARAAAREHPGWQIWDRNDLSRKLRELPLHCSAPIMRRFFPRLLADFLGISGPGPWLEPREYLHRMTQGAVYNHRWTLAGRTDTVDALAAFAIGEQGRVGLLTGRGGCGKTKILTAVCSVLADAAPPVAVRVLEHDADIDAGAFDQLPGQGRLLVVVDDAHDDALPLGKIVAGLRRASPSANLLLALRPYGLEQVRRQLASAGIHTIEALQVPVEELDLPSAAALAAEALDEPARGFAMRLAAAARDCPLLIVTGAALINRGELDPGAFEGDHRLRTELTDRLADALTAQPAAEAAARRELLRALAAYQPVHLADPEVRAALEGLTGLTFSQAAPHLSALEDAGVLLRRGDAVRVVPDLLGDALLTQAARHPGSGVPTGYLAQARDAARGAALRNLIVNVGRIDWQHRGTRGPGADLIDPLWEEVATEFRGADAALRVGALEVIAKVAFFQPGRALDLAAWTLEHPARPATVDVVPGVAHTVTDTDVARALAAVLRPVAWHLEHLPKAAELLWRLAQDDTRAPHQHPDHPLRVLQELAAYTRQGPTDHQRTIVAQVQRWMERAAETSAGRCPLELLQPLLATGGQEEQWTADALVFYPYVLGPVPQILQLRDTVLDLAFAQLTSPRLEWAAAAAALIGAAVTLPQSGFGLTVTVEMQQPWIAHFCDVLDRLRRTIAEHPLPPTVLVAVRARLRRPAEYGPEGLRQAARAALAAIARTPQNDLARVLHGGPVDSIDDPGVSARHDAQRQLFAQVVDVLSHEPDDRVAVLIDTLLADERLVFGADGGRARPFIWDLVTRRPALGRALCAHALRAPDRPLAQLASITLIALGQAGDEHTVAWGRRLARAGNVGLAREAAHAFGIQRGRTDLLTGEADLLRELAAHEDGVVRGAVLGAARHLAAQHETLAVELLFSALPDGPGLDEIALAFGPQPYGTLSWRQLPEHQKTAFLHALTVSASIDGYEIAQFLAHLARTEPVRVVELLERRVEAVEHERAPGYDPLPHLWQVTPPFREHEDYPALLRQIRQWLAAAPQSLWRAYLGGEIFALVAGRFDAPVLDVLDEYLDAPDLAKMNVLAAILRNAPRELVWNLDAVRRILRAADRCRPESLGAVQSALSAAIRSGGRVGSPGRPFAEDVEQRDKAEELAASCMRSSVEEQFYRSLADSARQAIDWASHVTAGPVDHRMWT